MSFYGSCRTAQPERAFSPGALGTRHSIKVSSPGPSLPARSLRHAARPQACLERSAWRSEMETTMETLIEPAERLFVPHRKRLFHSYIVNDEGARELRLYYGIKEISFDDE